MNEISVTILTRNVEHSIEACLNSLIGIADEIIVVDSFSTDSTLEICHHYGCKITQRKFSGFGAQRQYATSLTRYDYVLSIDSDEVLTPQLRESILELKKNGLTDHRVYKVKRRNFFCGTPVKHCGWRPDHVIRLFNKRYANWNIADIAETIEFPETLRPALLKGEMMHYRATSIDKLNETEDSHAALRGKVIAAKGHPIQAIAPIAYGIKAYMSTFFRHGGVLEGEIGRQIARRNYRSEVMAYQTARKIIKQQNA